MTRYRPGDMVMHGERQGKVVEVCPCGYTSTLVCVRFPWREQFFPKWIMADELQPVVERLPFRPRIVGGSDHHPDTLPSELNP